jgi:hypothetical protein
MTPPELAVHALPSIVAIICVVPVVPPVVPPGFPPFVGPVVLSPPPPQPAKSPKQTEAVMSARRLDRIVFSESSWVCGG